MFAALAAEALPAAPSALEVVREVVQDGATAVTVGEKRRRQDFAERGRARRGGDGAALACGDGGEDSDASDEPRVHRRRVKGRLAALARQTASSAPTAAAASAAIASLDTTIASLEGEKVSLLAQLLAYGAPGDVVVRISALAEIALDAFRPREESRTSLTSAQQVEAAAVSAVAAGTLDVATARALAHPRTAEERAMRARERNRLNARAHRRRKRQELAVRMAYVEHLAGVRAELCAALGLAPTRVEVVERQLFGAGGGGGGGGGGRGRRVRRVSGLLSFDDDAARSPSQGEQSSRAINAALGLASLAAMRAPPRPESPSAEAAVMTTAAGARAAVNAFAAGTAAAAWGPYAPKGYAPEGGRGDAYAAEGYAGAPWRQPAVDEYGGALQQQLMQQQLMQQQQLIQQQHVLLQQLQAQQAALLMAHGHLHPDARSLGDGRWAMYAPLACGGGASPQQRALPAARADAPPPCISPRTAVEEAVGMA